MEMLGLHRHRVRTDLLSAILLVGLFLGACRSQSRKQESLNPDGLTDNTDFLQKLIGSGPGEIVLPPGRYLTGTLDIPPNVTLHGSPGSRIVINPARLRAYDPQRAVSKTNLICVLALRGNDIELRNLTFDFSLLDGGGVAQKRPGALISSDGFSRLKFLGLAAERVEPVPPLPLEQRKGAGRYGNIPPEKSPFHLIQLRNGEDILMQGCRGTYLRNMLDLYQCARVVSRDNRAVSCRSITFSNLGEQYLLHTGNWSRDVVHQCRWWGGNANDERKLKETDPGWHTGSTVVRELKAGAPAFNPYTAGAFDVRVTDNYAEYGMTLAWGSKGRQVIFANNIGRYMADYVMGSEGGENVVFQGNIAMNGKACGIASYYWSEKMAVTGNVVVVSREKADPAWSWFADPAMYEGGFMRLHAQPDRSKLATGAGQIVVSGNVFSNEIDGRGGRVMIEAGRDVLFTGNKFRNGSVTTRNGSGDVVFTNNEFSYSAQPTSPAILIAAGVQSSVIRGNAFTMADGQSSEQPALDINCDGGEKFRMRVIDGNSTRGFPLALKLSAKGTQARFIVRDNLFLKGKMNLQAGGSSVMTRGNFDPESGQEITGMTEAPSRELKEKATDLEDPLETKMDDIRNALPEAAEAEPTE